VEGGSQFLVLALWFVFSRHTPMRHAFLCELEIRWRLLGGKSTIKNNVQKKFCRFKLTYKSTKSDIGSTAKFKKGIKFKWTQLNAELYADGFRARPALLLMLNMKRRNDNWHWMDLTTINSNNPTFVYKSPCSEAKT